VGGLTGARCLLVGSEMWDLIAGYIQPQVTEGGIGLTLSKTTEGVPGSSARGAAVESAATKRTSRVKSEIMMNLMGGIEFEV
jgi:hypothetical protein